MRKKEKCRKMWKWKEQFFNKKWLQINEKYHKKLMNNNRT
jgi:hypothetical protein